MIHLCMQVNKNDNVAVAVRTLSPGEVLFGSILVRETIPQGHKVALRLIPEGSAVIRYGVQLGDALHDIAAGEYVGENNIAAAAPPSLPACSRRCCARPHR